MLHVAVSSPTLPTTEAKPTMPTAPTAAPGPTPTVNKARDYDKVCVSCERWWCWPPTPIPSVVLQILSYTVKLTAEREALDAKLLRLKDQNESLWEENETLRKALAELKTSSVCIFWWVCSIYVCLSICDLCCDSPGVEVKLPQPL